MGHDGQNGFVVFHFSFVVAAVIDRRYRFSVRHGTCDFLFDFVAEPVAGQHGHVVVRFELNVRQNTQAGLARKDFLDVERARLHGGPV
jgi:hypothetical protein